MGVAAFFVSQIPENTVDPNDDLIPDSVIEKHLAALETDTIEDDDNEDPNSAADDSEPDEFDDDTSGENPDSDDEADDTDDEDAGDDADSDADEDDLDEEDDLEDEDSEEEDDLDTDEESPEDALLDKLPPFDRKKLEAVIKSDKSGELGKAYKHLRALATRATMAAATQAGEYNTFVETMQTAEGAVAFVKEVALANPAVAAAAFEQIAGGEGALQFLIDVGLANRKVFEDAYDRLVEFDGDEREKERHIKDRDQSAREQRITRHEEQRKTEAQRARATEISTTASSLAERAGLDAEDLKDVQERLTLRIRANKTRTGNADVTDEEIRDVVREVRRDIRKREERIAARLQLKNAKTRQEEVRQRANKPRRPAAPTAVSPAPRKRAFKVRPGEDEMFAAVDAAAARMNR